MELGLNWTAPSKATNFLKSYRTNNELFEFELVYASNAILTISNVINQRCSEDEAVPGWGWDGRESLRLRATRCQPPRDAKSWQLRKKKKVRTNFGSTPSSRLSTMAGKKRPADAGDGGAKKAKQSSTDRGSKRDKKSNPSNIDQSKSTTTTTQNPPNPAKSVLQLEEKSFPRGGGSVLTPLEHKQIHNEAARDVLFEQSGIKRSAPDSLSDEEGIERQKETAKPSKKRKKSKGSLEIKTSFEEARLDRVEGLSYRRLVPGSIVLGQVAQITSRDIALALPNNLTGYIPLASISDPLEKRVEKLLQPNDGELPDEEDEEEFEVTSNIIRFDVPTLTP